MADKLLLGAKIRSLRRREGWTQADLAARLEVSPSYLNLIEHNRRGVTAEILVKLARLFSWDLKAFSGDDDARLSAELLEAFGDSLFEAQDLQAAEIRDLAQLSPAVGRSVLALYRAYRDMRESTESLAARMSEGQDGAAGIGLERSLLPSEEVTDFIQGRGNYFAALEDGAELLRNSGLLAGDLFEGMVRYLDDHFHVDVTVETVAAMHGAVRRYDPRKRVLHLSESLRRGSRNFQVAYQVGLLTQGELIEQLVRDPLLTGDESRSLARVALANYFAGALLMPYARFLEEAEAERYDIEVLGNRFRTSFEQVCHRLTTLHRPGAEGVPFHLVRIDVAGNISKRFSASGLRFARFSGACPRWNVFASFVTPGMTRTQISQMPDGTTYFWMARALRKGAFGHHAPHTMFAIALGCEIRHAHRLVYADGVNLASREAVVPVGITCRICERHDCEQRAFPAIQSPLRIDENVRGVSFYAPVIDPPSS